MHKHIFVMIRYSVLTKSKSAWIIGKDQEFEEYRQTLFSSSRLKLHEELFEKVTFPSLCQMSEASTTVLVFTSDELPDENRNKLERLVGNKQNVKILTVSRDEAVIHKMNSELIKVLKGFDGDVCYATVRLDDDDALADTFEDELLRYVAPEFDQHAVSFPVGFNAYYEEGKYVAFKSIKYPMIALGLSYINVFYQLGKEPFKVSAYSLGNHRTIDERFPVIMKSHVPMFVRTIHEESDMYQKEGQKKNKLANEENLEAIKDRFHFFRQNDSLCFSGPVGERLANAEKHNGYVVTFHGSALCYSARDNCLLHVDASQPQKDAQLHWLRYDPSSNQLVIDKLSKVVDMNASGEVILCDGRAPLNLLDQHQGFSISPAGSGVFLTPLRNGKVVLSPYCRAWEIFRVS
ncbi:MAG: glycosyltransferase [Halomonas sp.]